MQLARLELFVGSILVAVDFIFDLAGCRRRWYHPLDVEKVVTILMSAPIYVWEVNTTYVQVTEVVG